MNSNIIGEIIDKESNLSRIPPWPLRILLVSLIFTSLFNSDSKKSPNWLIPPVIKAIINA